jgi:hypothetical protein
MNKLLLASILLVCPIVSFANSAATESVSITKRDGIDSNTYNMWQQIISDAGIYGSSEDANTAKQMYQSLDLETLSQVAGFYNQSDFLAYEKGLARLNQIIYRINTHAYPAS